jgi:hypothetical protein
MTEFKKITELDPITEVTNEDYIEVSQKQAPEAENPYLAKKFILGNFANLTYWSGTQAQYDALGTYDSSTIYFIEEEVSS